MAKMKNTGLGRGLDAIFLDNSSDAGEHVSMLRLSEIEPNPNQARREFEPEALSQLADSIAANGLIQPIVVRGSKNEGYYEIVAGERRWRASKMAGLTEVPVIIMELDDLRAAQISLIENIQRENLNAIEEANAFKMLMNDFAMTQDDLAKQVGKSRSLISNTLRLLDLPEPVMKMVARNELSPGHARALLGLKNRDNIETAANIAVKKGLSVRGMEMLVASYNRLDDELRRTEEQPEEEGVHVDYIGELCRKMTSRLGRRVMIRNRGRKRRLEIEYQNNNDLEQIVRKLCGDNIFDED